VVAAVSDVPDVTGQKIAVGAGHRLSLKRAFQKGAAKRLDQCYFAIFCRPIKYVA